MQIVIDIPEDVYKRTVFYREFRDLSDCVATIKALEKATPLPKGHGRIEADKAESEDRDADSARIKLTLVAAIVNMRDDVIWELIEKACEEVQDADSD